MAIALLNLSKLWLPAQGLGSTFMFHIRGRAQRFYRQLTVAGGWEGRGLTPPILPLPRNFPFSHRMVIQLRITG